MAGWVRLCAIAEAPGLGKVAEYEVEGVGICLANVEGNLAAVDNLCPHRQGPLGQGWIEGKAVVCPWHSWAFDVRTGAGEYPEGERIGVFAVRVDGDDVMVNVD